MKHYIQNRRGLGALSRRGRQDGAVLVFGLIMLLVLTLLGVSTMKGSIFDEKMSGNARNGNYAFQASESALREGELWLRDRIVEPLQTATGSSGVWDTNAPGAGDWWANGGGPWSTAAPAVTTYAGLSNVQAQPQVIMEYSKFVGDEAGTGDGAPTGKVYYRVTSKATGGTDTAVVQLQTMYSRRY